MDKHYHEAVNKWVTDKEVKGLTIYGQLALNYTKEELIKAIIFLEKEHKRRLETTKRNYGFLDELKGMKSANKSNIKI